jgi:hypothetical protein
MATLVRCIEGHAFDMTASTTCPICGSTVWKAESVKVEKAPKAPLMTIESAVGVASIIFTIAMIIGGAWGIRQLMPPGGIKEVLSSVWKKGHPDPLRLDHDTSESLRKKFGIKPDDAPGGAQFKFNPPSKRQQGPIWAPVANEASRTGAAKAVPPAPEPESIPNPFKD